MGAARPNAARGGAPLPPDDRMGAAGPQRTPIFAQGVPLPHSAEWLEAVRAPEFEKARRGTSASTHALNLPLRSHLQLFSPV